jgi:hypothetical protein
MSIDFTLPSNVIEAFKRDGTTRAATGGADML